MKKFLVLLVIPILVLSFALNSFAQEFPDVNENHWAYKEIETLAKEGGVVGYPDGSFKADSLVDRAEFSTMVIKALAQEHSPIKTEIKFEDVPYSHWAYDMIQRAVYFELIDGNAKNFDPDGYVTKAHSVSVAINALETRPITPAKAMVVLSQNYTDFKDIPSWLVVPAAKAEILGITAKIPGEEKEFAAMKNATRAELAVLVYKMREEAKLNPNKKLAEAMKPKKGEGIVIPEAKVKGPMGIIPEGTLLPIALVDKLSSQTNEEGEIVLTTANKNLISKEGYILLLEGSNIAGEIQEVLVGRYFVRNGKVIVETNLISTPIGQKTKFDGIIDTTPKRNWIARILRAIFKGGKINLKAGDVVYVKLDHPLKIDLSCGWIFTK